MSSLSGTGRAADDATHLSAEIYGLYAMYGFNCPDKVVRDFVARDLYKIIAARNEGIDWLANLTITKPLEEIRRIFKEHGVIVLRDLDTSPDLLLGCGNSPVDPHFHSTDHSHAGTITVNPELSMNPTVVAAWGIDEGLNDVLPQDHFETLYMEAVTIASSAAEFTSKKTGREALRCLKKDFKTYEWAHNDPQPFLQSSLFWYD